MEGQPLPQQEEGGGGIPWFIPLLTSQSPVSALIGQA